MKEFYYYIFYMFYLFYEASFFRYSSEHKATILLSMFETLLFMSFLFYFNAFSDIEISSSGILVISCFFVILLSVKDFFIFGDSKKNKLYFKKFKKYPIGKKYFYGGLSIGLIILIISNLVFSVYCFAKSRGTW